MERQKSKSKAQREKEDRRRLRFWNFMAPQVERYVKRRFDFIADDFDPSQIEGPVLVVINHSCVYDPLLIGSVFRNKPLTFVASEHILRMRPWGPLLDRYASVIPHQKGARGNRTALSAIKRIKRGESVFLAPEGEQTWDGRPMPVMPYTGKLAKASGATLVTYVIEGGYLSAPRWALSDRKGKIYGHPAGIYTPEMLSGMSDEEVDAVIARDLAFDSIEWQKSNPEGPVSYRALKGGNADGLERSVFTCPECGSIGSLSADGDHIGCSCGFRVRLSDTGFFEQPAPFETLTEWEALDKRTLGSVLTDSLSPGTVFTDNNVRLIRINDKHSDEEAARGTLALRCDDSGTLALVIGDFSFDLRKITNMTMVLAGRIVFSGETGGESGYYELRSAKGSRTNLRKYVIARELISGGTNNWIIQQQITNSGV